MASVLKRSRIERRAGNVGLDDGKMRKYYNLVYKGRENDNNFDEHILPFV